MKTVSPLKKYFKLIIILSVLSFIGFLVMTGGLFIYTDPPILHGNLEYNIKYKEGRSLDLYLPTVKVYSEVPVIIFYHGGAWIVGSKETVNNPLFSKAINRLREQGYAIVAPAYTLGKPEQSPFPACIEDAFDALSWVQKESGTYHFDLNNVGVFGESAGAHIALMAGYANPELYASSKTLDVQYVIDVYGPTDLAQLYQDKAPLLDSIDQVVSILPKGIRANFDITNYLFGFDPSLDAARTLDFTNRFSPVQQINNNSPNTLIIHGDQDRIVPISQSLTLKKQLDSMNIPNEFHILEGVDHVFFGSTSKQRKDVQDWIVTFVEQQYRPKPITQ